MQFIMLPSRFVIHTVGPVYFEHTPVEAEALLTSCYENSLNLAKEDYPEFLPIR